MIIIFISEYFEYIILGPEGYNLIQYRIRKMIHYRMINSYSFVFTSEYILYFHLRSALSVLKSAVIENGVQISRIKTLRRKMIFSSP